MYSRLQNAQRLHDLKVSAPVFPSTVFRSETGPVPQTILHDQFSLSDGGGSTDCTEHFDRLWASSTDCTEPFDTLWASSADCTEHFDTLWSSSTDCTEHLDRLWASFTAIVSSKAWLSREL